MSDPDPRDEIVWGASALRAVAGLIQEVGQCRQSFELVDLVDLGELLEMVEGRISHAAKGMEKYQPRD